MSITHETWTQCRADYVTGKGSLATVAARHGLRRGSVEKRARREDWTRLRREYEQRQLEKLLPPAIPALPPVPVAPDGVVSPAWLSHRQELYYRENATLLDRLRVLLTKRLTDEKDLGPDGLAKLTSALGGIVDAENKLLGLRERRKEKRRQAPRVYDQPEPIEPIPVEPAPVETHSTP